MVKAVSQISSQNSIIQKPETINTKINHENQSPLFRSQSRSIVKTISRVSSQDSIISKIVQ
jgi:hypothetical protein